MSDDLEPGQPTTAEGHDNDRVSAEQAPPGGAPLRWDWHVDVIAVHLDAASRGDLKHLVIWIPPRSMMSLGAIGGAHRAR